MKAIITGSGGLLGTALQRNIPYYYKQVYQTRQDCDLTKKEETCEYFLKKIQEKNIDTIIHCAAKVGGVQANINNNEKFFLDNFLINSNVVDCAIQFKFKNVVNILSTCIFPNKEIMYPLTADQIDNGAPHQSNYGYSYAKRLLYHTTKYCREVTGNNWISIIPTNIYGTGDNFNLENSHLIPALIRKGYEASEKGENFVVWGDGTPLRQFIYSDDLAKIILWAIDNWQSGVPMMAVNDVEYSIRDVVNIIANRFKINQERIKYDISKPNGQFKKTASSNVPKEFSFISLEDGINKTIDWYINNVDKTRR